MINFDGVIISERCTEEVISFFWRSVYDGKTTTTTEMNPIKLEFLDFFEEFRRKGDNTLNPLWILFFITPRNSFWLNLPSPEMEKEKQKQAT